MDRQRMCLNKMERKEIYLPKQNLEELDSKITMCRSFRLTLCTAQLLHWKWDLKSEILKLFSFALHRNNHTWFPSCSPARSSQNCNLTKQPESPEDHAVGAYR